MHLGGIVAFDRDLTPGIHAACLAATTCFHAKNFAQAKYFDMHLLQYSPTPKNCGNKVEVPIMDVCRKQAHDV